MLSHFLTQEIIQSRGEKRQSRRGNCGSVSPDSGQWFKLQFHISVWQSQILVMYWQLKFNNGPQLAEKINKPALISLGWIEWTLDTSVLNWSSNHLIYVVNSKELDKLLRASNFSKQPSNFSKQHIKYFYFLVKALWLFRARPDPSDNHGANLHNGVKWDSQVETDGATKVGHEGTQLKSISLLESEELQLYGNNLFTFSKRTLWSKTICNTEYFPPQTKSFSTHLFL